MLKKKGFTLIELMVVILIVSILAAVAIPIMRGRIDAAKWSEGRAMMGTIGTALRAYYAEKGDAGSEPPTLTELGFATGDLTGTYFSDSDFSWANAAYNGLLDPPLTFTILGANTSGGNSGSPPSTPTSMSLDHLGAWLP